MLTVAEAKSIAKLSLGGGDPPTGLPILDLIHEAGDLLTNLHPWAWLVGQTATVNIVDDQDYVELPEDFGEFQTHGPPRYLGRISTNLDVSIELVDIQAIVDARGGGGALAPLDFAYLGALVWTVSPSLNPSGGSSGEPDSGELRARLELWPTPSAADTFSITYRRRWRRVEQDGDTLSMPRYMVPLFKEVLRAVVRGNVREDAATLDERLAQIVKGTVFAAAKRTDATVQSVYGPIQGGAADSRRWTTAFRSGTVNAPS